MSSPALTSLPSRNSRDLMMPFTCGRISAIRLAETRPGSSAVMATGCGCSVTTLTCNCGCGGGAAFSELQAANAAAYPPSLDAGEPVSITTVPFDTVRTARVGATADGK